MHYAVARALAAIAEQHGFLGTYATCGKEMTKAAIQAHEKALEAEGLVIVPREPTDAMLKAGDAKEPIMATLSSDCSDGLGVWQAMVDAALERES